MRARHRSEAVPLVQREVLVPGPAHARLLSVLLGLVCDRRLDKRRGHLLLELEPLEAVGEQGAVRGVVDGCGGHGGVGVRELGRVGESKGKLNGEEMGAKMRSRFSDSGFGEIDRARINRSFARTVVAPFTAETPPEQ